MDIGVSTDVMKPLQSNVATLERTPSLANQRPLSWLVGVATYYAKFIPAFAELC